MHTTYTWRAVDGDGTHMTLRNHGEPFGLREAHRAPHGPGDAAGDDPGPRRPALDPRIGLSRDPHPAA
ncbi:MAG: hypothetical protein R2695_01675 [Acidimicrobiales bacterium]